MSKGKKKRLKKTPIFLLILLIAIGGVVYYFLNNKDKVPSLNGVINTVDKTIKKKVEPPKLKIINEDSNNRNIAVMINNVNAAWKYQAGLSKAYIVYTLLAEGGITREMAVFRDNIEDDMKIMSIRSSRHYYLDYALENDAIYVHWGWSPYAQSDIKKYKVNNINGLYYEGSYFQRDKEVRKHVSSEHTGYITIANIKKASEKLKYRTTSDSPLVLSYNVTPIDLSKNTDVKDVEHLEIRYSAYYTAKYDYDETTKKYVKTQNKTEMYDYNNNERIAFKNIITYQVPYASIAGDKKGRLNATTVGSGTGYFISEGKYVPITWEKTDRTSKTVYKYKDGTPLVVNDGNTAIEIQPKGQKITFVEPQVKDDEPDDKKVPNDID